MIDSVENALDERLDPFRWRDRQLASKLDRLETVGAGLFVAEGDLVVQRAIDAGCQFAGATVHQETAELDHGQILAQAVVPVLPGDTAESLAARVLTQEHLMYPAAVAAFFKP
jgi:hypothetical protein